MIANETTVQETKMKKTLTTIGHRTAFNNEQSPYRIVSYKRPRYDNVKQFKRENLRPIGHACLSSITKLKLIFFNFRAIFCIFFNQHVMTVSFAPKHVNLIKFLQ